MRDKVRLILSAKFGLIIILFLMPFINVSCGGVANVSLSGIDLVTGTTVEDEKIKPEKFAILAFGCAVGGLVIGLRRPKYIYILNAVFGGGGAMALLLLKNRIDKEILKEGEGMITVSYKFAFWASLLLFIAAAVTSIYLLNKEKAEKRR